jgi:hypothetical protein
VAKYITIWTYVLPTLDEVRLYADTNDHVKMQHPEIPAELPSIVNAVINAISNPTHVEKSHGGSVVFVDAATTNASGDPLRVPVKRVIGTSGRVRTFYFATASSAVDIIWRRKP